MAFDPHLNRGGIIVYREGSILKVGEVGRTYEVGIQHQEPFEAKLTAITGPYSCGRLFYEFMDKNGTTHMFPWDGKSFKRYLDGEPLTVNVCEAPNQDISK